MSGNEGPRGSAAVVRFVGPLLLGVAASAVLSRTAGGALAWWLISEGPGGDISSVSGWVIATWALACPAANGLAVGITGALLLAPRCSLIVTAALLAAAYQLVFARLVGSWDGLLSLVGNVPFALWQAGVVAATGVLGWTVAWSLFCRRHTRV